jgi:hypothetical protein
MYRRIGRLPSLQGSLLYSWLVVVAATAIAEEPEVAAAKRTASLVVSEKGERLITTLTTTNGPPKLFRTASGFIVPIFPADFNWEEYARIRAAIKDLEANAEDAWPSIVEHMTDPAYCFTVEAYDSAYNYSRGDVCYEIARSWLNRAYAGSMPMDRPLYQYQAPHAMKPESLREWCRARRDKELHEMQVEAGEWAISIIPRESKMPKESQDKAIAAIQERIVKLRGSRKPIPGKFFVTDVICPYAEKDAARFQRMAKENP